MKNDGWIRVHRKILDNPVVCKDADHFAIWNYLLLTATHKKYETYWKGHKITLKPGQLITGRSKIADRLNVHESKVQRVLKRFESEQQIEQQKSNQNRLISIVNWHEYQVTEQQNEQPVNNERTTSEQPVNTYKNVKNERMKEKNNSDKSGKDLSAARNLLNDVYQYFDVEVIKGLTEKQKNDWIDQIEKLHRIDGYEYEDIRDVIIWARTNEFWEKNFLSIPSLRKKRDGVSKFFKIIKSMRYEENKPSNGKSGISREKVWKISEKLYKNREKYGLE